MTRVLSALLGNNSPSFQLELNQLERDSGLPGVDIRLTSDIIKRTQRKLHQLNLDPKDTTLQELYVVLGQRLARDQQVVDNFLDLKIDSSPDLVLDRVASFLIKATPDRVIALKSSSLRRLLQISPPTEAMKQLGYRSLASMLKREAGSTILTVAKMVENQSWWQEHYELYEQMTANDFELRPLELVKLSMPKVQQLAVNHSIKLRQNFICLSQLGIVALLPLQQPSPVKALSLVLIMALTDAINDVRSASSYLRFNLLRPSFGQAAKAVASGPVYADIKLATHPVAWRSLHRHYARRISNYPIDIIDPYLSGDDLRWGSPEQILAEIDQSLEFWRDTQDCALIDQNGNCVSMNLFDVVVSYGNQAPFEAREQNYLARSVMQELVSQYLGPSLNQLS